MLSLLQAFMVKHTAEARLQAPVLMRVISLIICIIIETFATAAEARATLHHMALVSATSSKKHRSSLHNGWSRHSELQ